jgi:hypothetical protein
MKRARVTCDDAIKAGLPRKTALELFVRGTMSRSAISAYDAYLRKQFGK